jgi:iron complex transport system substrate-binding protein
MMTLSSSQSRCFAALALAALVVACGRQPSPTAAADARPATPRVAPYPIEVRDDLRRAVTLAAEPKRIVSLLPSHTETLFALGLGAQVVGVDDYSDDPPEVTRLPSLGGLYDAHLEVILSLKPDLVLLSGSSTAYIPLEQSGLTVWAGGAQTFDDVFRVIELIGKMVDRNREATRLLERIRQEMAAIEGRLVETERVSVYYELDATPYTVGPSSFIGVLLAKAGADNVVPQGLGDFPKINPEVVISGNPSIILGASLEEIANRPGWNKIAAVQTGRVYELPKSESQLVARPGPRIAEGLRVLAHRLHPEVDL